MKKYFSLLLLASAMLLSLAGCSGGTQTDPKTTLLNEMSGVWVAKSDNTMITIDFEKNTFRLMLGDELKDVTLGDVDTQNETVNIKAKNKENNQTLIWTLKRVWEDKEKKTSFHLLLTVHTGAQEDLAFIRKITTDDQNRIEKAAQDAINAAAQSVVSNAIASDPEPEQAPPPAQAQPVEQHKDDQPAPTQAEQASSAQ